MQTSKKLVNIKFLKQGLLKAEVPADLEGAFLSMYCQEILDNASDKELIEAMADAGVASDGSYPHGMFDANCFQVEMVEDAKTFDQLFQTKTWEYFGEDDAISDLEAEKKSMGDFLEKQLGFSSDNVSDIAHGGTKLYSVHVVYDNELKRFKLCTKKEQVLETYIKLCKEWYSDEGFENFSNENELVDIVTQYDNYYNSEQYHDACDNAHVTWEVLDNGY